MDDTGSLLEAAREAREQRDWPRAHDLFTRAAQASPLSPTDLDAFSDVAWWLGRVDECLQASERAFRGHLDDHRPRAAVMTALQSAVSLALRGDEAHANGALFVGRRDG